MKKEEERQQLTISADTRKPSKERTSKKKSKPIIKEPERKEKIKEGEIIKIKEQIDTLLEKLEKMERTTEDISVIDIKCSLKEPNNPTKPEIKPSKEFTETVKEIKRKSEK